MDLNNAIIEFTRYYLAIFYSGVALFYTVRIVSSQRRQRCSLVYSGKLGSAHWWNHLTFRMFRVLIWWVCLARALYPTTDDYLGILPTISVFPVIAIGVLLLSAGFFFTIAVHFSLGAQWRSGIDPRGPVSLKTDGLYRFSRNPMYLGVATAQVGFFLALPSVFSAVCLVIGMTALHRQTAEEEAHLLSRFADEYPRYRQSVRRWL